jgi:hypothetical protein
MEFEPTNVTIIIMSEKYVPECLTSSQTCFRIGEESVGSADFYRKLVSMEERTFTFVIKENYEKFQSAIVNLYINVLKLK